MQNYKHINTSLSMQYQMLPTRRAICSVDSQLKLENITPRYFLQFACDFENG